MKYLRQLLRQPVKFIAGLIVVSLAVSILCVCLGQSIAANKTEATLEYHFTTIALPTTKYNYAESYFTDFEGNKIPYLRWSQTLPDELAEWIGNTVQTRTDLVEGLATPGLASAYISELNPDNLTHHRYFYPMVGEQEATAPHRLEAQPTYSCAMLEMELLEIGEPVGTIFKGVLEDGTEMSITTEVSVELIGTVKSVISLEEGYADPTGRTIYLTLVLPDVESLDALQLETGERYLVYGSDYLDGDWALRGHISDSLSSRLGTNVNLEELDAESFYFFTEAELEALAQIAPNTDYYAQYTYAGCTVDVWEWQMKNHNAVFLTARDETLFGAYERIEYSDGSGSYPSINWEHWLTDENGNPVQVTQEDYSKLYSIPTIVHLEGSAEDFLQSENGQLWASQLDLMEVNFHAFPVIGVEKLGYVADFARETARIVDGRDFTQEELTSGAKVCIISETLAAANGLRVGDTILPHFYDYDWNSPYQGFISESEGVVNPSAYAYAQHTEFAGEAVSYVIIGLYRQDNAWGDVSENLYSFTPNTIFVPHASVSSDMDYGNQAFFQTLILKNGMIEEFRTLVNEAGYEDLYVYYDQEYTTISDSLQNYREVAQRAMQVGVIVYGIILVLFLFLFPGSQRKVLSTMNAMGTHRRYKIAQVVMTSAGILAPGAVIGTLAGMLLWQRVINALAESVGTAVTLEMDIVTIIMVALGQLVLALVLTVLLALPMTRDKGIAKRM